ncbi:MAG TPA: type II toxin-antitoxin system PemK/MazF family toxin, partial [Desulfotomaculum sp.]|nr:type II toxin-antitoxin system PemK/MazF family toxin [Desulfotomaculum sp.]
MVTYRWNIFWTELDPALGPEQAGKRPVLVISAEEVNQALPIVTVLPLTAYKSARRIYPTEALLPAEITGLPKDSIALAHQIRTVTKKRLYEQCGTVEDEDLRKQILQALK